MNDVFSKLFNSKVDAAEANDDMRKAEGDYCKDGLLYCGKCNTPKEMNPPEEMIGFMNRKIPIPCKCMEARMGAEDEERKRQQKRLRAEGMIHELDEIGVTYVPDCYFSSSDRVGEKTEVEVRSYVSNFAQNLENGIGMMLFGGTGRGKTFYAACIANELVRKGYMVMFTSIRKIADAPKEEKPFIMRNVRDCDLLILDDFGAERETGYMTQETFEIVDTRCISKKPLIITTNLNPNSMLEEKDTAFSRIYKRVKAMCIPLYVNGPDRRDDVAARNATERQKQIDEEWKKWGDEEP